MVVEIKVTIDDFRISHLFDIDEPVPENILTDILSARHYKIVNQRVIDHPPIRATIINLAAINHVNIMYQKDSIPSYIGVSGKDKREVLKQFDTLSSILTEVDPTVQQRYTMIEVVLIAKVWGRDLPEKSIPKFAFKDSSLFNKIFGEELPMKMWSFVLQNYNAKEVDVGYSIIFSPLLRSRRYYYVQLVCRTKDMLKAEEFAKNGEQIIKDAVSILEQG